MYRKQLDRGLILTGNAMTNNHQKYIIQNANIANSMLQKIGFGCGNFGGIGSQPKFYGSGNNRSQAFDLLDICKAIGITRFDTANSYGGGLSESTLGEWLSRQDSSYRQQISISSKVGNPYGVIGADSNPLSREEITANIDRSLKRLRVDTIDVYYVHELNSHADAQEILEAFSKARRLGKIRTMGLSNVSKSQIAVFLDLIKNDNGKDNGNDNGSLLSEVQNEFNLLVSNDASSLINWLAKRNIKYVGFSPLAGGLLTSRDQNSQDANPRNSRSSLAPELFTRFKPSVVNQKIEELKALASRPENSEASIASLALQYCLQSNGVSTVLISPKTPAQFRTLGFTY